MIVAGIGFFLSVGDTRAIPVDLPLDAAAAQVYWRWIYHGSAACPLPESWGGSWISRKLFEDAPTIRALYPVLEDFCLLEKIGGPVTPEEIDYLESHDLGKADQVPDIGLAVSGAGRFTESEVLTPAEVDALEERFYKQVGEISQLPDRAPSPSQTRLTIFDTSPTTGANSLQESSPHGESLTLLARRLLCNGIFDCKVDVRTRLALAYRKIDPLSRPGSIYDEADGGYLGLISELAEVLVQELEEWTLQESPGDRLIVNLSLGWDRLYGGSEPGVDSMPIPVQAVHRALEALACEGALVVAAAGNLSDIHLGNDVDEALFPAAWTDRFSTLCDASPPLLYAAGGADVKRQPLASSLAAGMPELAVFSDHAIARGEDTNMILTGTSVAALGLSATIAALAYYAPDMPAEEIFATIHGSGEPTAMQADLCYEGSTTCPQVRYVSLCESVKSACQSSYGICAQQQQPGCEARPEELLSFSKKTGFLYDFDGSAWPSHDFQGFCANGNYIDEPVKAFSPPVDPCPRWQYHGLPRKPGAHPQPQSSKCPTCNNNLSLSGSTFYGEISGLSTGQCLGAPTLILSSCSEGSSTQIYQVGTGPICNNSETIGLSGLPRCATAALSYTLYMNGQLQGSMTDPVLVVDQQ